MKSSFELAMERFGGPAKKLTDAQKKDIAEVDSKYKSKIVQLQLSADDRIRKNPDEAEKLRTQIASEIASLQEKCENEKNKIRGD